MTTNNLPDYIVSVNPKYIIPIVKSSNNELKIIKGTSDTNNSSIDNNNSNNDETIEKSIDRSNENNEKSKDNSKKERGRNKKRPRDTRVSQQDRLCSFISRGLKCKFESCYYNHDALDYLSRKSPDLGDNCYQYTVYGWCTNGIMCRFGKSHIDYTTGKNLIRSDSDGGIKSKVNFNILSKLVQIDLRKRKYDFKKKLTNQLQRAITVTSTVDLDSTETVDQLTSENNNNDNDNDNKIEVVESNSSVTDTVQTETTEVKEVNIHSNNLNINNKNDYPDLSAYDSFVKLVDFSNKVYVAPLTTVGNLPFRRILKDFGADITCGEMAMASNILEGQSSEWALLRRHSSEDVFGIQIAGSHPDILQKTAALLENETISNFVDLNCGCPIDIVCNRGCGSALLNKQNKLCDIVKTMSKYLSRSITVKIRTGWDDKNPTAHKLIPQLQKVSQGKLAAIMIHGRSRLQRYSKLANWEYILQAANSQDRNYPLIPIIGNGDILSWHDWESYQNILQTNIHDSESIGLCSCAMIGRGALVKPWLPTEIKYRRDFDISASERLDMLKKFCNYGFEHWGSDQQGINTTRRFLLEWLSFLHRYVPVGLTEQPQKMSQRPPHYFGRCDMETLMASANSKDWIRISELLLGPVDDSFEFAPKHKSSSYAPGTEDSISNG